MKKQLLASIMCFILMALSGCSQQADIENKETDAEQEESTIEQYVTSNTKIAEETGNDEETQNEEEEDQYAIYQRFLEGEEPLYIREDTWFGTITMDYGKELEGGRFYEFYEICNIINIVFNSGAPVNELSNNISYAYVDSGADGSIELALLFHDLSDYADPEDVTLIIKDLNGQLELCYIIQPNYRQKWLLDADGIIGLDYNVGTGMQLKEFGYIDADGTYNIIYSEDGVYGSIWEFADIFPDMSDDEVISIITYELDENQDGSLNYYLVAYSKYSTVDDESIFEEVSEWYKFEDYSYEWISRDELQDKLEKVKAEFGISSESDEIKAIEWIPLDDRNYNLIYGVEKSPEVSDMARAIEAYRRFLSDNGHFKEALSYGIGDGLDVLSGIIDGFFIKDMDNDDIPELLIGMSARDSQCIFIYKFDTESGRVKLFFDDIGEALGASFGCEEYIYNDVVAEYPEFADSFFYTMNYCQHIQYAQAPLRIGYNSENELVWFNRGVDLGTNREMYCKNFETGDEFYFYEDGGMADDDDTYAYYEVIGSKKEAISKLQGYKQILFYDVTQENIDKYVVEDYIGVGIEDYSEQDIIDDINRQDSFMRNSYDELKATGYFTNRGDKIGYNIDNLIQIYYFGY